ncbi:unnamed protein product [Linum tenue]|uniref:Uncharacterized protein n=1 Tax=Linum tenue TaxID=586396 RepID=A0AAV0R946_9ROSI|nr:unnamed protein product [Linum tenue]
MKPQNQSAHCPISILSKSLMFSFLFLSLLRETKQWNKKKILIKNQKYFAKH